MPSFVANTFGQPAASLGFVGFVKFPTLNSGNGGTVRATSCDIRLSQDISKPDVVDSRYDKTVWQLGPKIIEGSVSFPAIFDRGGANTIAEDLFDKACNRDGVGKLAELPIDVKYTSSNAAFQYQKNIVDTFSFSVAQSDVVTISIGVIGAGRITMSDSTEPLGIDNVRIVTWNDAIVEIDLTSNVAGQGEGKIGGESIRSFDMTLANNAQRFYTLNGSLTPQDIAPTIREITGTVVVMGRIPMLAEHAEENEKTCFDESKIKFGYAVQSSSGCGASFDRTLPNCVFEIEELALTNELFETTVNYHSLPAASVKEDELCESGTA